MIANETINEVKRLLHDTALSNRKIAARMGVSRGFVDGVANGKITERKERKQEEDALEQTGPKQRCPTCGGMVFMPCRLCHVRLLKYGPALC